MTTPTLIDHIVTNTPDKVSDSGVIHTGISDHSLVFTIRKISVVKKLENTVEIRKMKKFDIQKFVEDIMIQPWENAYFFYRNSKGKMGNLENALLGSFRQTCTSTTQKD